MNHLQWIVSQDLSLTSSTSPDSRGIFLTSHLIFFKDIFTFLKEVRRKKNECLLFYHTITENKYRRKHHGCRNVIIRILKRCM